MLIYFLMTVLTVESVVPGGSNDSTFLLAAPEFDRLNSSKEVISNVSTNDPSSPQPQDNIQIEHKSNSSVDGVFDSNLISPLTVCGTLASGSGVIRTKYGDLFIECVRANMTTGFVVKNGLPEYLYCNFVETPPTNDLQHFTEVPIWKMMKIIEMCSVLEPTKIAPNSFTLWSTMYQWVHSFFNMVWPRTLWCGLDTLAENWNHLGASTETDRCCRQHDTCPLRVRGQGSGPGTIRVACQCERRFRQCLLEENSPTARVVYFVYFVALRSELQCIETKHIDK